jgi:hypothetical protein
MSIWCQEMAGVFWHEIDNVSIPGLRFQEKIRHEIDIPAIWCHENPGCRTIPQ